MDACRLTSRERTDRLSSVSRCEALQNLRFPGSEAMLFDCRRGRMLARHEEKLVIVIDTASRIAIEHNLAVIEHENAVTESRQRLHLMRAQHNRRSSVAQFANAPITLLLKSSIADGQHFINEQNIGILECRGGKSETQE